jgi:hypothetical protein
MSSLTLSRRSKVCRIEGRFFRDKPEFEQRVLFITNKTNGPFIQISPHPRFCIPPRAAAKKYRKFEQIQPPVFILDYWHGKRFLLILRIDKRIDTHRQ